MNRLITFEGIEGSGKSTQIRQAADDLAKRHLPVILTSEPSGTDIGKKIGDILFHRGHTALCAEAEALLFFAARAQHVRQLVAPGLAQGNWVLCDRYSDATLAYQGAGRCLDADFLTRINDYSSMGLKPSLTLLFDLPVEVGLQRAKHRDDLRPDASRVDRFEREALDFHNRVRQAYLQFAKDEPARFRIIDAARDPQSVFEDVCRHLSDFMDGRDAAL